MNVVGVIDPQVEEIGTPITADAGEVADRVGRTSWLVEHLKRRRWPLVVMLIFVVVSLAYSLWWNPIVHRSP